MADYRNPVLAEAMKVLGFVNRFSRGVMRVKDELRENGNGEPKFSLDLGTAFMVTEPISADVIKYYPNEEQSKEKDNINKEKSKEKDNINKEKSKEKELLSDIERNVLKVIEDNPTMTYTSISDNIGISENYVYKLIKKLKDKGWIKREDGRKHGCWVILKTLE